MLRKTLNKINHKWHCKTTYTTEHKTQKIQLPIRKKHPYLTPRNPMHRYSLPTQRKPALTVMQELLHHIP